MQDDISIERLDNSEGTRRVYLVERGAYESEHIFGVFTTEGLALEYAKKCVQVAPCEHYTITECLLDPTFNLKRSNFT